MKGHSLAVQLVKGFEMEQKPTKANSEDASEPSLLIQYSFRAKKALASMGIA